MQEGWLFYLVNSSKIKEIEVHSDYDKFGDGRMRHVILSIGIKLRRIMSILVFLCKALLASILIMKKWIRDRLYITVGDLL